MKKYLRKISVILLSFSIIVSFIPFCVVTANATNTSDEIVSIALSELGKTDHSKYYGGHYNAWCADFVTWCAQQAGVTSITNSSSCTAMYNGMIKNGCQEVSTPQKGDLVFYYNSTRDSWMHVGIMIDSSTAISGNYWLNNYSQVAKHNYSSYWDETGAKCTAVFVRPNYHTDVYADLGTDFYAYITSTAHWLYLSNDYYNVSAKSATYLTEQIWKFERQSDNSYAIKSSSDDTFLDVENAVAANQTNVQTCEYTGSDAQKWYLLQAGDNKYVIRSKLGNYVLDLAGGSNVSGTNVQIYEPNGTDAQYFSIYKYDTPAKTNVNVEVDGTSVRVKWDTVSGCARYDVYLLQSPWGWSDIKYSKKIDFSMNYCEFKNVAPGDYAAFVVTKPNDKYTQSVWAYFSVENNDLIPNKQIVYKDHIYSLYNDVMTWNEAKIQCENMGGHLVTVTSEEEQSVIEELVKDSFCSWYFMGASNTENGVDYKWVTGESFDYTNWKNGSPDNVNENYLMATRNLNGGWQDTTVDGYSCLVGFICEVETGQILPQETVYYNGHTYELYDEVLTWEDAEEFAKLKGGYLTAVTSKDENEFIYSLTQKGEQYYYWLGGKGDSKEGYTWSNNENFKYSNWADGEPNNSNFVEHYLMQYKNSSEWNDSSNFRNSIGFVIEYDTLKDYLIGDINNDGVVNVMDATELQKHIAGTTTLDDEALLRADVDSDDSINIKDATLIQKYSASLITEF